MRTNNMRIAAILPPAAIACALALALGGCGGGGSTTATTTTIPSSPATAAATTSNASADAVASVAGTPIARAGYEHWLAVERALGGSSNPGHEALAFLITSQWVLGEAAARKLSVSAAEVKQRLAKVKQQSFPKASSFERFLSSSGETEADLLARVKVELLQERIAAQASAGKSGSQRSVTLAAFERAFQQRWKAQTTCKPGYVMEDCMEYRGKPEDLAIKHTGSSSSASTAGSAASASSSSSTRSSSAAGTSAGELPPPAPGAMTISSSAFERDGALPAQYTCAGANTSPPLQWQNVPAKAAALVLFAIDDTTPGAAGGIRWIVGDIDPTSKGVAAGQTPEGGIVGTNTQGHTGYGGICPPHGKTATIEFVLYALRKKIPLTPGFQPTLAESEYGAGKLLMGSAAVTYATAQGG